MQYGSAVFEEAELQASQYAPISEEHLTEVIRAVLSKLMAELRPSRAVKATKLDQAEQQLYQGVRSTLEVLGLLLSEDEGIG
ncbi:MAG: hypothetical protein ACYC5M_17420 [Anaerolineae bacterium]